MSVLEEHETSPGLLLALLGYDAMRRLRAAHDAHGLEPHQFQILGLLGAQGSASVSSAGMELDPSVVVGLLNPLEDRGFVATAIRRSPPPHREPHARRCRAP